MLTSRIVELLGAQPVFIGDETSLGAEVTAVFATDLMSDALAMIQDSPETTLLLTGLCNPQVLRTADMLDLHTIVFVRGKNPVNNLTELANEMNLNLYSTCLTMYEACGVLYSVGIQGIER